MGGSGRNFTVTTPSDREIVMTRVFDGPRDLVSRRTSCEHLTHWWGPRRYEIVSCEVDFRPGGAWRIVNLGPDGEEYASRGEYRSSGRSASCGLLSSRACPEAFQWTVRLEEHDGKATLTATSVFDSVEERDGMLQSGMESGAAETSDRLDEYLEVLKGANAG